jgi:hypothetical protein
MKKAYLLSMVMTVISLAVLAQGCLLDGLLGGAAGH